MVDGAHHFEEVKSGTVATTKTGTSDIVTITVPSAGGPEGQVIASGWAFGYETDGGLDAWYQRLVMAAGETATSVITHDPNTSGWAGVTLTTSGNDIILRVEGAVSTNIRWYGELHVKFIDIDLAGG